MDKTTENIFSAITGFAAVIGTAVICSKVRKTMKAMDDALIKSIETDPAVKMVDQNPRVDAIKMIADRYEPAKYDKTFNELDAIEVNELAALKENVIRLKDVIAKSVAIPDKHGDLTPIYDMLVTINDDIINSRLVLIELLTKIYEEIEDEEPNDEFDGSWEDDDDDYEDDEWESDNNESPCMDPNCDCQNYPKNPSKRSVRINVGNIRPFAFNKLFEQTNQSEDDSSNELEQDTTSQYNDIEDQSEDDVVVSEEFNYEPASKQDDEDYVENPRNENERGEGIELDINSDNSVESSEIAEEDNPIENPVKKLSIGESMKEQIKNADGDSEERTDSAGIMLGLKVPKEYIFKNKQENGMYEIELLNPSISDRYRGMIYWGDDTQEAFDTEDTNSLSHEYKKVKDRIIKVVITNELNCINDTILNPEMHCTILTSVQLSENALMEMKIIK